MRHLIILLLILGCFVLPSCDRNLTGPDSAADLNIASEFQGEFPLLKIVFVDAQHGWALSDSNGLYHTRDGGSTWKLQPLGRKTRFLDMSFVDPLSGWICGFDTTLLRTSDGGYTWQRQIVPQPVDSAFQHVDFINEREGWLFTPWGDVYGSRNGGTTWDLLSRLQRPGISFVKMWDNAGVISQLYGSVLRTEDGGLSWRNLSIPDERAGDVFFVDANRGWLLQSQSPFS